MEKTKHNQNPYSATEALGAPPAGVETDAMQMQDPPTNVRWRILALLMAYAGLLHFNRISISVAGTEHIMQDYSISETEMGLVYSAYLVIYTLCMMPGGWLIDRFGPKQALLRLGFASAVLVPMTGLTGFITAGSILLPLIVIRGLLGVASAPMHPGAARAVSFWMPARTRGVANGLVTGAAVMGVASTYYAFGFLMDLVGWPWAFVVAGIATLLLTIAWTVYATDYPAEHAGANASERQLIEEPERVNVESDPVSSDEPEPSAQDAGKRIEEVGAAARAASQRGFLAMLCNRSLVMLTISYATLSYFQYLFFYWMQYYFDKVLELGKDTGRLYATIPTVAMAAGMISGGWIADRMESRFGGWSGRAIVPVLGMIGSAVLLVMGILSSEPVWVVICFALAMGALGASEAPFWLTGIELGGRRGGLSAAILNTGGNAGGLLAPVITPLFSEYFGWQAGLGLASVLCIIGAGLWWWIDPTEGRKDEG